MATGSEIANAYVTLTVKAPGIAKSVQEQFGKVNASGAGSQIGSKLAAGMKKSLKVGAVGVASVLGTALVKGFGRLKSIETAEAKMRGIGFTSEEVAGAMDNALASVKGTAFGLGDAATTASQLMAANIAPGEKLEKVLKTVANNAALAGADFGEMGSIFAKAATQANGVQNDVIGQLADKGIPIYKALGDQMGVTAGEVFKLASQGKIDFETFAAAAEAAAGTAAAEMGGTTTGAFDNMMAALGRLGAKILEDVYPLIGPLFGDITKWLDEVTPKVEPLVAVLGDKLKSAMQFVGDAFAWVKNNSTWLAPTAVAVGGMVGAIWAWNTATKIWLGIQGLVKGVQAAYIAATYGQVGATYAAGGAQKFLNAVMKANPIMLVVTALAGLVAGLVWFFTKTELGKKIWGEFTRFLSEAWANVSSFFVTVYEQYLKPVFDGIAAVATWVFENILKPHFQAAQVAFAVLGGILSGIWENILKPVFVGLGKIAMWLWSNAIKPAFDAIGKVFTWISETIIGPVVNWIKKKIQQWALVMSYLWTKYVKPVFDKISAIFKKVWSTVISPVINWIKKKLDFMGLGFKIMWGVVRQVWDNVTGKIKSGWDKIRSIIDTLTSVVKSDPKKAFEAARDAIGTAWNGIRELAAKPVRFVVDVVIGGLIDTINKIPGVNLPKPKLPKGFATGGILPGSSRMSQGDDQLIAARRGEGIMVSEALRSSADRAAFLAVNAAGRRGVGFAEHLQGFARGGLINPLPRGSYTVSQPYHSGHNGIDLAAPQGTKVYAAASGTVGLAGSVPMGGNEIYIQHGNGLGTRYSHLSRFATKVGARVKQGHVIGYVGSTGMSTGPHLHYMVHNPGLGAGSYSPNVNPASYMGLYGKDLGEAGGASSILDGLVDWAASKVKKAFPDGGMWVDIAAGLAKDAAKAMSKAFNPFAASDTGATLYDQGGWLQPGRHIVENKSGRPEPILTAAQWDALLDSNGGSGVTVLKVGEREFTAYVDERAEGAVDRGFEDADAMRRRAAYA